MTWQNLTAGLGLRAPHLKAFAESIPSEIDFFEIHPENYIRRGGKGFRHFQKVAAQKPIFAHGLTLGFGNPQKPDAKYLKTLKAFLHEYKAPFYSDHLCISAGHASELHDLLPLPFTPQTAQIVADRICYLQDELDLPIAIENVSTYMRPYPDPMTETEFTNLVLEKSGAGLLLDVNNVLVNSRNHNLDAKKMLRDLAVQKIFYCHLAGFHQRESGLLIDTHGSPIHTDAWQLLEYLGSLIPLPPVLIERDNNIPDDPTELIAEVQRAKKIVIESRIKNNRENLETPKINFDHTDSAHKEVLSVFEKLILTARDQSVTEVLSDSPQSLQKHWLNLTSERQTIYRELVAGNVEAILKKALPMTVQKLGDDFIKHRDAFLAAEKITSRFYRDIPELFAAFINLPLALEEAALFSLKTAQEILIPQINPDLEIANALAVLNPAYRVVIDESKNTKVFVRTPIYLTIHEYNLPKPAITLLQKISGREQIPITELLELSELSEAEFVNILEVMLTTQIIVGIMPNR